MRWKTKKDENLWKFSDIKMIAKKRGELFQKEKNKQTNQRKQNLDKNYQLEIQTKQIILYETQSLRIGAFGYWRIRIQFRKWKFFL